MRKTIFFEFFGKNMKTTVEASSDDRAIAMVRNRINIIRIENDDDSVAEDLLNIFNMKK